jgi:hypothetical protein
MKQEQMKTKCTDMTDEELVRALTLEKENYSADFLRIATQEMANRKEVWKFTNSVNEALLLQKEVSFWTIHLFDRDEYYQSFVVKTSKDAADFLTRFLRLEDQEYTVEYQYDLGACETLAKSNSQRYIQKLSKSILQ